MGTTEDVVFVITKAEDFDTVHFPEPLVDTADVLELLAGIINH
jgi:hypothetical protein